MSQASNEKRYIPALSFRWLTPLYDPLLKWVMREETFKRKLTGLSLMKAEKHEFEV